mmetsp:Transcript_23342/g.28215  ORF Transcript_23342/g.28215 Transcript_23342/m.28215 type:complete len:324 (+) Transcript_23342:214-1185(+)
MADQNPFNEQPNPFDNQEPNPFADTGAPDAGSAGGPSLSGTGTGDAFNPFYEGRQANPFSSQDSGSPYDGATTQAIQETGGGSAFSGGGGDAEAALKLKEKELEKRLAEVQRREKALASGGSTGGKEKNFPPYFPMVHHNIEEDIPQDKQHVVKHCFYCYLGILGCLLWNTIAVTAAMLTGDVGVASWLWCIIYCMAGVPGAWYLWYERLYEACKGDRALSFAFFFLAFSIHCVFVVWCALAPDLGNQSSTTGLFMTFEMMEEDTVIGVFYLIGCVAWGLEALFSVYVMKLTYRMFRGSGLDDKLQGEAIAAGAQASAAASRV